MYTFFTNLITTYLIKLLINSAVRFDNLETYFVHLINP